VSGDSAAPAADDPEATAKLPVLELAPTPDHSASGSSTDVMPVSAFPAATAELADRLREVEERLQRDAHRVRELEALLANSTDRVASLETDLARARARQSDLEAQLEGQRNLTQRQSQMLVEARASASPGSERDAGELRRRCERQMEALSSWEGFRAITDSLLAEAESRDAMFQSRLGDLDGLRAEVLSLRPQLAAMRDRQQQSDHKAEEQAARARDLESEIHATVVMMGEERPRARPVRALVRRQDGGDVVHALGHRITIGRTADNDIQIDVHNVSRHHAVVLETAEGFVVEDLNSTNGVQVNGQRVTRQVLADGDRLTIGKTDFTFRQHT
jgi:hypothetical protein